jgi:protein O-GlcNAc transferase
LISDANEIRLLQTAVEHHRAGRLEQAETLYRQILQRNPRHAEALHYRGLLAAQVGRRDLAIDLIRRALAIAPRNADAYSNLGNLLKDEGRLEEALAAHRQAIALAPSLPEAHYHRGVALEIENRHEEALAAYRQAIALRPNYPEVHYNLGVILEGQGRPEEALAAHRQAVAHRSDFPDAHFSLGNLLQEQGRLEEAIGAYRQAVAFRPHFAEAYNDLGNALKDTGRSDAALAAYRQALACKLDFPCAQSNLFYSLYFHPAYDDAAIAAEMRRWNDRFAAPLQRYIQPHGNNRDPERPLRIGYVSPDFCTQAECFFTVPLLEHHDHTQFEIHGYSSVRHPDELTNRIRAGADRWHEVRLDSDEALARRIRDDRIDILVDLTMHMGDNRVFVFARKPAPVQICWLAYPGSTGLSTIDYRLTDVHLDPSDAHGSCYPEQPFRLPDTWVVYDPLCDIPPRPAEQSGPITFGSFNNQVKYNDPLLGLWARLLQAIPESRLVLQIRTPGFRRHILDLMRSADIAPQRLSFIPPMLRPDYLRAYDQIDIALDPLPYNGITTTCDALFMGVPVLTLVGQTVCGRAGYSQLMNLRLPELITYSPDQFIATATTLARDLPRLQSLRSSLRRRMEQSPLMDAPTFTHAIETAYRQMWRTWCAK